MRNKKLVFDQIIGSIFAQAIDRKDRVSGTYVHIVVINRCEVLSEHAVSICGFACHELWRIFVESFNFKLVLVRRNQLDKNSLKWHATSLAF